MLIKPTIGGWEPPRIDTVSLVEARRNVVLPVVGLSGDLQQDLGRRGLAVEIRGALYGDEARDAFLLEIKAKFEAGQPVDFVADIVNEATLEQVIIEALEFQQSGDRPDIFGYRVVLREYTEPPEPPGLGDFDPGLDDLIDLDALAGLDLLDLPGLLGDVPDIGDLLSPVRDGAEELKETLGGVSEVFSPLSALFGGDDG